MSLPTSKPEFQEWCFRKLGQPVIEIEVSDSQADDRIDEAVLYWNDWSSDGTSHQYYKYQLTANDISNSYITLPANIIGAVGIFDCGDIEGSQYMFNVRYQIALNDLYTLTSVSMVPYYMAYQHLQLLEQILVGQKQIRYNRIMNQLYLDMDWSLWNPGMYIIVDCYQVIDPAIYTNMWSDRTLMLLATAYIKKQWGTNIGKYSQVPMLGGVMFNGEQIARQAELEIQDIERVIKTQYQEPPMAMVG